MKCYAFPIKLLCTPVRRARFCCSIFILGGFWEVIRQVQLLARMHWRRVWVLVPRQSPKAPRMNKQQDRTKVAHAYRCGHMIKPIVKSKVLHIFSGHSLCGVGPGSTSRISAHSDFCWSVGRVTSGSFIFCSISNPLNRATRSRS